MQREVPGLQDLSGENAETLRLYGIDTEPTRNFGIQCLTILWLLGLDHERLTYRHAGRDFRLTDVHGKVVHDVVA
jgi:hypothetical protein